jgi:MFS family permease
MKDGFTYVWTNRGLRFLMLAAGVINFFAMIGIVLIIPLFHQTEWLGPSRYGVLMAVFTAAMVAGMSTTAAVTIPAHRRMLIFGISTVGFVTPLIFLPFFNAFWPMLVCVIVGGYFNAIVNVLIQSVLQLAVPEHFRGKVFGLLETMTGGLTPIGMAIGGVLGEIFPLKWVIGAGFALIGVYIFPQLGSKRIRDFFVFVGGETSGANGSVGGGNAKETGGSGSKTSGDNGAGA